MVSCLLKKPSAGDVGFELLTFSMATQCACDYTTELKLCTLLFRGRVKHGRHFTFKSVLGDTAITFVAASVTGTFVNPTTPYASHGPWLQVLIPDDLAAEMARDFDILSANVEDITLPRTFSWGRHRLNITVVAD